MERKLKVLNTEYDMVEINAQYIDEHKGMAFLETKTIEVYNGADKSTVLHELIHAYLHEMGHFCWVEDHPGVHTENNVRVFETVLMHMISDGHLSYSHEPVVDMKEMVSCELQG